MYDTVLVPTDGRPGTEGAVARGIDLARTFESGVHALYVVETAAEPAEATGTERETARERLHEQGHAATVSVQEAAAEFDLEVAREIRDGAPYRTILEYADEHGVDAIAMGRRRAETAGLGSTAQRVLTRADVPVLVAPPDDPGPETGYAAYDRVVIPVDGSDTAARAADHALTVAERYGADVRVVYVVDTTTYGYGDAPRSIVGLLKDGGRNAVEAVADDARDRNLPVSTALLRGDPGDAILRYAEGADADLIAMGTRGQAALEETFLGSTTTHVLERSPVPVLTVS
ncbi:MAG: universal stress protein [Halobacteriales archaeon]